jgi:hypothetical protein
MSLNAGAGAGSSCPDVAVERRLRVPTLFWSTTVQNAIPMRAVVVRVHAVVCPPAGRQALLSVAPASFVRTADAFSIQHTIEILALSEVACTTDHVTDRHRHRAAGYRPMAEAAHTGRAVRGGRRPVGRRAGARRLGPRGGPVLPGQCSGAAEHPRRPSS